MTRRPVVPPHPPAVDPTVPADQDVRLFCRRCSLAIVDGDPRHSMPPAGEPDVRQRAAGDDR